MEDLMTIYTKRSREASSHETSQHVDSLRYTMLDELVPSRHILSVFVLENGNPTRSFALDLTYEDASRPGQTLLHFVHDRVYSLAGTYIHDEAIEHYQAIRTLGQGNRAAVAVEDGTEEPDSDRGDETAATYIRFCDMYSSMGG
jgi:hypothetical protein